MDRRGSMSIHATGGSYVGSIEAHLDFDPKLLRHGTRLLVPDHRLLLQTEQHRRDTLDCALECLRVPGVCAVPVEWVGGGRDVVKGEEGGEDGCVVCEVFLESVHEGQVYGKQRHVCGQGAKKIRSVWGILAE